MGRHAVLFIGPAGSGKSTLCSLLQTHYELIHRRTVHLWNLDPAAEHLCYEPQVDIRTLITVEDVMRSEGLGPNGALVWCLEYFLQDDSWVTEQLGDFVDDFLLFDFPGQVEVTANVPVVPRFAELLQRAGYYVVTLFLLDAVAATSDVGKYIGGCLMSLSAMVCFDCPFVNVLTKCDLLPALSCREDLEAGQEEGEEEGAAMEMLSHYSHLDFDYLPLRGNLPSRWGSLLRALAGVLSDHHTAAFQLSAGSMVAYLSHLASTIDQLTQYMEDAEVRDRDIEPMGNDG